MADIQLSDDSLRLIEERVRTGPYKTADDVVRAGLRSLTDDEYISRLIQQGENDIAAGRFHDFGENDDMVQSIIDRSNTGKQTA